jgi:RNA polymerase sigma factor (sigma-70 family)
MLGTPSRLLRHRAFSTWNGRDLDSTFTSVDKNRWVAADKANVTIFVQNRELLDAFRLGRAKALEAVYWEYVDRVAAVVRHNARHLDHDAQRDIVQETFSRAFSERSRLAYDGINQYRPYLLAICRNTVADWFRKHGREVPSEWVQDDPRLAEPSEQEQPAWAEPETIAVVETYIASLDPKLRRLYELRYDKGFSQQLTAERMGSTRQEVRTLEQRLRKGLAKRLKKAGLM